MVSIPDEKILFESKSEALILTTHRVRFEARGFGASDFTSLMLEEIVSCEFVYRSHPALIILGLVAAVSGFVLRGYLEFAWMIGLILMAIFLLAYLLTIERVLLLASCNAVIGVPIRELGMQNVRSFIDTLEAAKNARFLLAGSIRGGEQPRQGISGLEGLSDARREPTFTPPGC